MRALSYAVLGVLAGMQLCTASGLELQVNSSSTLKKETVYYDLEDGATCADGFVPLTSSWEDCRDAAHYLGYEGDVVNFVDQHASDCGHWGTARPQGCFFATGNNRVQFNCGPGGNAVSGDKILCQRNIPVTPVIKLLKEMGSKLLTDETTDDAIWDRMHCWCEINEKDKTKAIADAETRIGKLATEIEKLSAESVILRKEIAKLEREKAKSIAALDQATALRQKQLAEFRSEEQELINSIQALHSAVVILTKHHTDLLQVSAPHLKGIASTVQNEMQKHNSLLRGVLTPTQHRVLTSFIQQPDDFFDAQPSKKHSYSAESGQIYGILTQMKEEFENNLKSTQDQEKLDGKAYEDVKAAKTVEITAGQEQIDAKTILLADTDNKNAKAKEDKEDTQASLEADTTFLTNLKEKCADTEAEYEDRRSKRQAELEAITQARTTLEAQTSTDLFHRTFNFVQTESSVQHARHTGAPNFVQIKSSMRSDRLTEASQFLSSESGKLQNPRLAEFALKVKIDAFTDAKKTIDTMVADLIQEEEDEVKKKDFCNKELQTNKLAKEKRDRKVVELDNKILQLGQTIAALTQAIDDLNAEITTLNNNLQAANATRIQEHSVFLTTVDDQRATQAVLKQAMEYLKGFYHINQKYVAAKALELAQTKQEPPPDFGEKYKNNEMSGGVMDMLQKIIDDAILMEKETIRDEEDAEEAFRAFVKSTNEALAAKTNSKLAKTKAKAEAEEAKVQAENDKGSTETELGDLATSKSDLHTNCDFTLKNFETRQVARRQEIAALRKAKQILSGAKFDAFLQHH